MSIVRWKGKVIHYNNFNSHKNIPFSLGFSQLKFQNNCTRLKMNTHFFTVFLLSRFRKTLSFFFSYFSIMVFILDVLILSFILHCFSWIFHCYNHYACCSLSSSFSIDVDLNFRSTLKAFPEFSSLIITGIHFKILLNTF